MIPRKISSCTWNSPGGSVYAGLGIYDTMQYVNPDVATICTGMAASMGAVLLAAGSPKETIGFAPQPIMIHQPSAGMQGTSKDGNFLEANHWTPSGFVQHFGESILVKHSIKSRRFWPRLLDARHRNQRIWPDWRSFGTKTLILSLVRFSRLANLALLLCLDFG